MSDETSELDTSEAPIDQAALTDHEYDGIREYDNPLPAWWSWLFVGSIVFSAIYWVYYEGGMPGRDVYSAYDQAVADNLRLQFAEIGELQPDRETLLKYLNDDKWLKVGQTVYAANCVSCHGAGAGGIVGPNLTDERWKHVQNIEDIAQVLIKGAQGGAMPAWQNRLHPNEIVLTAAYIASLKGSNPPNAKGAEGNFVVTDWGGEG
ncbi:cbb3-type cytochrome c oxidase N-terminal domain-containing protein [Calycomorphotria hydatis]|uniref:Cbb3-type cytochrome c oxidase subunit CcoP2 n=1 Tax=Calycomorphotria hydatis TaxID=2528027 RepID=A0A517T3P4_9PLAN|nr:cbb3-type cytochrome c oxidase N-terminal domain-containing protein [Calycomorphotria hydatis]QDT62998.1 Cbb3-type cytochrome c oxidase subunit CcoP2 [Calycomorphotria hydatis]